MPTETSTKIATPPYVSYRTFVNFLQDMAQGVPNQIDRSAFPTMSGGTFNQLLPALRYLGLIDSSDKPLEILKRLSKADGDERQKQLSAIVHKSYNFLFTDFDLTASTPKLLEDRFRDNGAGGETTRKCITFFLHIAKDAGIVISNRIVKRSHSGDTKPTRQRKKTKIHHEDKVQDDGSHETGDEQETSKSDRLALAQQILERYDPNWPTETQQNYLKFTEQLMNMVSSKDK